MIVRRLPEGKKLNYVVILLVLILGQAFWLLHRLDPGEKLACEALVVAVAAIVIALRHADGLETVAEGLGTLAQSVQTRGLGVFPSYMSEVAGLVSRATESITILCDTPAHGAFSNSAAFTKYWMGLRRLMVEGDVSITCSFFNEAGRDQLHRAQIDADREHWSEWKERNRDNCEAFDRLAKDMRVEPPSRGGAQGAVSVWADTPDKYVESMMEINEGVLSSFDSSIQVEPLKFNNPLYEGPSVYFWLRDKDQEAVFVIVPVRGIGVRDLAGFHTREPELIRALYTVYQHRAESSPSTGSHSPPGTPSAQGTRKPKRVKKSRG